MAEREALFRLDEVRVLMPRPRDIVKEPEGGMIQCRASRYFC